MLSNLPHLPFPPRPARKRQRGFCLAVVLFVLVLAALIAALALSGGD
ncbi:MAG: hypothetical protein V3573_03915 [Desulfovibrionaceae bacterium]